MEIPLGNFFEVTINSHKLATFAEDIHKKIQSQSQRMDQISKTMSNFISSLGNKIKKNEEMLQIQLQKMRRINQEETNYFRLFLKDIDKKTFQKIDSFENTITFLSHKINQTKDTIQDDLSIKLSYFQKKLQNTILSQDIQKKIKIEIDAIKNNHNFLSKTLDQKFKVLQLDLDKQSQIKTKFILEENQEAKIQEREYSHKCLSIRTPCLTNSRKRLKSHRNATLGDVDKIVNKISQLESRLKQQKDNLINEKGKSQKNGNKSAHHSYNSNEQFNPKESIQLEKQVASKLLKIEDMIISKLGQCQSNVSRISNKTEIMNQQIGIILRKYQKEKIRLNQAINSFRRLDQKKIDQRAIESIKNSIKKIDKELQETIETKLNIEIFDKQKNKNAERIRALNDIIIEKAEKSEVKKGFSFFQQKIKEIIIVLAEQKNYNKDSATKKIPIKCLSCDKQLELNNIEQNQTIQKYLRDSTTSTTRCSTTLLRKKIRAKNNSSLANYD